jgi:hypothetical protein
MKDIRCTTLYPTVSVRTFVIPFYYGSGSGSAKAKSYGSYASGSATLVTAHTTVHRSCTGSICIDTELFFFVTSSLNPTKRVKASACLNIWLCG